MNFFKNWTLPISILTGIAGYFVYTNIPWLDGTHGIVNEAVNVIQPLLIFTMLFLTFLNVGPHDLRLRSWHFILVGIQLLFFGSVAIALSMIESYEVRIILESCMLCLLCPTATAAAVVTRKLGGSAADITSYTILINLSIAVAAPLLLPLAHPHEGLSFIPAFIKIICKVLPLLIFPLLCAWGVRRWLPSLRKALIKYPDMAFYLWSVALTLAIAVTVKAIVHSGVAPLYLFTMAGVTLMCCIIQFFLGKKIGRRYSSETEGGQALGQKNTVFIIWLGYTFLSPVTAVAGGLYSVWHNLYNSYQLYRHNK